MFGPLEDGKSLLMAQNYTLTCLPNEFENKQVAKLSLFIAGAWAHQICISFRFQVVVEPCCICFVFLNCSLSLEAGFFTQDCGQKREKNISQEVSKRVGSVGYHPFTKHLLTSWDILAGFTPEEQYAQWPQVLTPTRLPLL